ncbi:hypothetical protein [Cellulomonas timonensis]|uniref:hypothetical protein n=1 Tax=Cellulomonas timonensis TaxID=1689271 RepID=UPI00082AED99|nr:hypothetical protein [Cellulomonas timonensis]
MTAQQLVPRQWRDDFILTLRHRDATGAQIGDALAQVESYCAESNETAGEAFGDAREYAQSLPFPPSTESGTNMSRAQLLRLGASLAGMLVTITAASGWASGTNPSLTLGLAVSIPLVLGLAAAIVRMVDAPHRSTWRLAATLMAAFAAVGAAQIALDQTLVTVPAAPLLAAGLALLLTPPCWEAIRGGRVEPDVITGPFDDPEDVRRRNARAAALIPWILPAMTVPAVAMALVVATLG